MSNGNNNHKNKVYPFPAPFIIRSDAPILITDGKVRLLHKGDIIVRSTSQFIELEPQEPQEKEIEVPEILQVTEPIKPRTIVPEDYGFLTSTTSHKTKTIYDYYKRDKDLSYMVLVKIGNNVRPYKLGSLFDANSIIGTALNEFSRRKPFSRRDLKLESMPPHLKQGQIIKSCLDILAHEGYLERRIFNRGEIKVERFWRTPKMLS